MGKSSSEIANLSLAEAARMVETKQVSPVELVDACLERIARINDKLKAYITVYEQARDIAKAMEAMQGAGHRRGALHGVQSVSKSRMGLNAGASSAGSKVLN